MPGRTLTLALLLAGASMIVGDLLCTPRSWSGWYQLGIGLLFWSLMSVNHHLGQMTLATPTGHVVARTVPAPGGVAGADSHIAAASSSTPGPSR